LLLWQVDPHQRRSKIGRVSYEAKGEPDTGINIFSPVRVVWGGEGLYWFELTTQNGKLMAKTPLRIFVGTPEEINRKVEARNQTGL
jgi:hypothetical protein